jgi:hypothetical protein
MFKNCSIKATNTVKYNVNTYCNTPNFNPGNKNGCFEGLNTKQQNGNGAGVEEIFANIILRLASDVSIYSNKRLKNAKTLVA